MATRKVTVERHVEQVRDGSHYKGYLKIDDTKFDYELVFGVPIAKLDSIEPAKDEKEVRHLFQLMVKRGNANIELTMEEYGFFISMVADLAIEFYNNTQTRNNNEGVLGDMLQGRSPLAALGVSMSIGLTSGGSYEFDSGICKMLSAPKFGCSLVA